MRRINPERFEKNCARTVVPVNFSVSSPQGNATRVILATTNTRTTLEKFAARKGEEDICQNIFQGEYLSLE